MMKKLLEIMVLSFFFSVNSFADEWKVKNKWKVSCGIVEEDPYLEIDYRRVGKKYENEREVKIFPVELKEEALNLYKNFLVKTIK